MNIKEDELQDIKDQNFQDGQRSVYIKMLHEALNGLGYPKEFEFQKLAIERAETIQKLRSLCDEHGDNDWDEDLHLADIIDNHLGL